MGSRDAPAPFRAPRAVEPATPVATDGGGATTLLGSEGEAPLRVPVEFTDGGGCTTSVGPRIFPRRLLSNPVLLLAVAGGGGTTALNGSCGVALASPRTSRETSPGGGAITDGAGNESFASPVIARSGADTGGGTTARSVACTGARESSWLAAPGAGGITFAATAGADRILSGPTLGAGATTAVSKFGALRDPECETFGAGGTTAGTMTGATSACSRETLAAGGTISALRFGAVSGCVRDRVGAGAMTCSIATPFRV